VIRGILETVMRISAVILAKDEEKNIGDAIKSVDFCDEVIVIDDNSTDKTVEIALSLGAKVFTRSLEDNFAGQRNFGLEKAKGEWVLFLDCDERISEKLRQEIVAEISKPSQIKAYYIKRVDIIWGKRFRFGENSNIKLLRVVRKGTGDWKRKVHEFWEVGGYKQTLINPVVHYPHQNLSKFIDEVNFYSTLHAEENMGEGKHSSLAKIILWPKLKFFRDTLLRLGILDGVYGFVIAILMSFHSFLAWSKQWIRQNQR